VVLGVDLGDGASDGDDPGRYVQVAGPELGQLAPPQPGAQRDFDEQPGGVRGQRDEQRLELVRCDDPILLHRHGRGLHAAAGVQDHDEVVQRGGEHRRQDDLQMPDLCRADASHVEFGDPLADMGRQDVPHLHRSEPRQDVPVQAVAVALPSRGLEDVVREPLVVDIAFKADLSAVAAVWTPGALRRFSALPCDVGVFAGRIRPGGTSPAAVVVVVGGVSTSAIGADSLAAVTHADVLFP